MRKVLLSLVMVLGLFGATALAQHRDYRPDYNPVGRQENVYYQRYHPVIVEVYIDQYGNVIRTNSMLDRNMRYGEAFRREAEYQARARYYKPTGKFRKKRVYIYFSY